MGEMIESVKFIPLESSEKALLNAVMVRKLGDIYCVVNDFPNCIMKLFDAKGNYIRDPFLIGRARDEVAMLSSYTVNVPGREIIANSVLTEKLIFFNLDSLNYKTVYKNDVSFQRLYPLGKGHYVTRPDNNSVVLGATIEEK